MPITQQLALTLPSKILQISRACRAVTDFCVGNALARPAERRLQLVLEELITNTVRHGLAPATALIDVRLALDEGEVRLVYIDRGMPFDPRNDLPRDTRELPLEQRGVGGMGWPLILHYCELAEYRYSDGENHYAFVLRVSE